jgi:hypothetical protein
LDFSLDFSLNFAKQLTERLGQAIGTLRDVILHRGDIALHSQKLVDKLKTCQDSYLHWGCIASIAADIAHFFIHDPGYLANMGVCFLSLGGKTVIPIQYADFDGATVGGGHILAT